MFILLFALDFKLQAQYDLTNSLSRSTSSISCRIVNPIGILKIQDLYFGKIVSGNSGTVILSPNGDFPRTTGGVALQTNAGTYASALFEISDGLDNSPTSQHIYTGYSISLPTQDVVMIGESGETMTVGNFTSNSSPSGYGNFVNGNGILRVGATLHVGPFQGIGKYISSAPFQVTVNFY